MYYDVNKNYKQDISEEHLELALQILCVIGLDQPEGSDFYNIQKLASKAVVLYIIKKEDMHNDEEITKRFNELIIETTLKNMVSEGIVEAEFDENGKAIYSLTDFGKKRTKENKNDK